MSKHCAILRYPEIGNSRFNAIDSERMDFTCCCHLLCGNRNDDSSFKPYFSADTWALVHVKIINSIVLINEQCVLTITGGKGIPEME